MFTERSFPKQATVRTFVVVKKHWNIKYMSLNTYSVAHLVTWKSEYILIELVLMC